MENRMEIPKSEHSKKGGLSERKKNELRQAFVLFDSDKDERLSHQELRLALRSLGFEIKEADMQQLVGSPDGKQGGSSFNSDGARVTFDQFIEVVIILSSKQNPYEEIIRAFKMLDDDQTGKISLRNLRRASRELGEQLTDEEMRAMIEEFDKDGDGEISLDEFAAIMTDDGDDE